MRPSERPPRRRPQHQDVRLRRRPEGLAQPFDRDARAEGQRGADRGRDRHPAGHDPVPGLLGKEVAHPRIPRRARDGAERGHDEQEPEEARHRAPVGTPRAPPSTPSRRSPDQRRPPADGFPPAPALDERDGGELEHLGRRAEGGEETHFGIGGAEQEGVADEQRAAQERVADLGADAVGLVGAEAAAPRGIVQHRGRGRGRDSHGVSTIARQGTRGRNPPRVMHHSDTAPPCPHFRNREHATRCGR